MNPIYEKLFDSYCVQTLREVCPYDHESLEELLDSLSLGADIRLRLDDAFYEPVVRRRLLRGAAPGLIPLSR